MLSSPQSGWTDFTLGDPWCSLSYVTNVPMDWLEAAICGLESHQPFTVYGLCEPGRLMVTVERDECLVRFDERERDRFALEDFPAETVPVDMLTFCQCLYDDISTQLSAWSRWVPAVGAETEAEKQRYYADRADALRTRLTKLGILLHKERNR